MKLMRQEAEKLVRDVSMMVVRNGEVDSTHAAIGIPKGSILYVRMLSPYAGLEKTQWELRLSPSINPSTGWEDAEPLAKGKNLPSLIAPFVEGQVSEAKDVRVEAEDGTILLISKYQLGKLWSANESGEMLKKLSVTSVNAESGELRSNIANIIEHTTGLCLQVPGKDGKDTLILLEELLEIAREVFNE